MSIPETIEELEQAYQHMANHLSIILLLTENFESLMLASHIEYEALKQSAIEMRLGLEDINIALKTLKQQLSGPRRGTTDKLS